MFFSIQPPDLKDSSSAKAIAERHEAWKADLPKDEAALWDWLAALDDASRTGLLAHYISFGVNALYEKGDRYGGPGISVHGVQRRLVQAERLARAVGLDMVDAGWRPTVDNYLGRVTKPRIIEAVREAKGEQSSQLIDHLKKAEMAREAERLLEGTGWLPEPLRTSVADAAEAIDGNVAEGDAGLPLRRRGRHRRRRRGRACRDRRGIMTTSGAAFAVPAHISGYRPQRPAIAPGASF